MWVKAPVVQKRRGPADPGRDEYVASRLRPPAGRRTPDELARPGIEPVLGLEPLTGQVALSVHDPLWLTRRAAGECDQAWIGGLEIDSRRGGGGVQRLVGDGQDLAVGPGRGELAQVALIRDDQLGSRAVEAQAQILGPQLLVAGQRHSADAKAGDHGQDPFGTIADQRHDAIATCDSVARQRAGEARAAV